MLPTACRFPITLLAILLAVVACGDGGDPAASPDLWETVLAESEDAVFLEPTEVVAAEEEEEERRPSHEERVRARVFPSDPGDGKGDFVSIGVGGGYGCGLKKDGAIVCWGSDDDGQLTPPEGEFVSLSVGPKHSCAIRNDDSAVCWGDDGNSQITGLERLEESGEVRFHSISAGWEHTCGIMKTLPLDRSVFCWGLGYWDAEWIMEEERVTFRSIDAGEGHTCGLTTDGAFICWGDDQHGQASPPAGEFTSFSAGWNYTCGVRPNNTLECWGSDYADNRIKDSQPDGEFASVSVGHEHICAVRTDGTLECWGYSRGASVRPYGEFASVSAYSSIYTCGLRPGGAVVCWHPTGPAEGPP